MNAKRDIPIPPGFEAGRKVICRHSGSTLLIDGATYTILEVSGPFHGVKGSILIELAECKGFLFGLWRFEPVEA